MSSLALKSNAERIQGRSEKVFQRIPDPDGLHFQEPPPSHPPSSDRVNLLLLGPAACVGGFPVFCWLLSACFSQKIMARAVQQLQPSIRYGASRRPMNHWGGRNQRRRSSAGAVRWLRLYSEIYGLLRVELERGAGSGLCRHLQDNDHSMSATQSRSKRRGA